MYCPVIRGWQWPAVSHHQSGSSYNYTRSCQWTQHGPFYSHLGFEANLKGEKSWYMGASWANQKTKNWCFEVSSSLILCNNNKPFLNQIVMCDEKWILYDNWQWSALYLNQEEVQKHFPKPNLHQEKAMVTLWSTVILTHYSFLNPSETITSEKYAQQIDLLFSHPVMFDSLRPHGLLHARFPCPSSPGACSNSCP